MRKCIARSVALAVAIAAILAVAGSAPALAQQEGGTLQGKVTAEDGSPVRQAVVVITGVGGGAGHRALTTDANGEFQARFLPPGRYSVVIDRDGLRREQREVEVRKKETTSLDVELRIDDTESDDGRGPDAGRGIDSGEIPPEVFLMERTRADGTSSLGVGFEGPAIDSLELGLPAKLRRRLESAFITSGWTWDAGSGTASGPPVGDFRLRLDGPAGSKMPGQMKLVGELDDERVFDGKYRVAQQAAVDPTKVPYLGLPGVIVPGETVLLTAPPQPDVVVQASNDGWSGPIEFSDPAPAGGAGEDDSESDSDGGGDSDSDSGGDSDSDSGSDSGSDPGGGGHQSIGAVVPYGELSGPIEIVGVDPWGETIFRYDWTPVAVSAGLCARGSNITGVSDLNFAGQQLCICGCFGGDVPNGWFQIGGRPLGRPTGSTPYVANFNTPGDLTPGTYEVGWVPDAGGGGGPFQTEVIEILASINDEVIQKGGTTGLEMEIVGTDRALPVELTNLSPDKIEMAPADSIATTSTGGPGRNHVPDVKVTGRKTGTYFIDWKVDAGECPCAETLPEVEKIWVREADQILSELDSAVPLAEGPSDEAGLGSGDGSCGDGLAVGDGQWRVKIEWDDAPGAGSCRPFEPNGALFAAPGSTNWEVLVKVLDGCGFNDRYWVFYAATTNVEYEIRVTDTGRGEVKRYVNPSGRAPAIVDTAAFATCP